MSFLFHLSFSVSPGNIRTPLLDYMCSLEPDPDPEKALEGCKNTQVRQYDLDLYSLVKIYT
jgi:hypothetical protein